MPMLRWLFAALLIAFGSLAAHADERITSFESQATVATDASVAVTETISVMVEGRQIRHGIFRDFPTVYDNANGLRMQVSFVVNQVLLDGSSVPYKIEGISGGKRVRIGDASSYVSSGLHKYTISYTATREIGFFDTFDEFYWNVTGNGWSFPIDKARISVVLPAGADISRHSEYTGSAGAKGNNARAQVPANNRYVAETTTALDPGEGLTIAVAWQKGIVTPSSSVQSTWWKVQDNGWMIAGIVTPLAALLYYYVAWVRVGREPPSGQIIPLFYPPPSIGAAEARYLVEQGFDNKAFAAALVGLATKGGLKISDDESGTRSLLKVPGSLAAPSEAEKAAYAALPEMRFAIRQSNYRTIQALKGAIEQSLSRQFVGNYFNRNGKWLVPGVLVSLAGLAYAAWASPSQIGIPVVFVCVWLGIWWSATLSGLLGAVGSMLTGRSLAAKAGAAAKLLFLLPFVAIGIAVPVGAIHFGATSPEMLFIGGIALALVLINVLFFKLMPAATPSGQKVMDQIEGFRLYLSTAEEDRLNALNPPEKTPELFERYLPYAIALDCENEWGAKFASVLAAAAAVGAAAAPAWYSGHGWSPHAASSFGSDLGHSLASTLGSSSSAPGSSSGSGGGGFSGGGGGGGGGGGW